DQQALVPRWRLAQGVYCRGLRSVRGCVPCKSTHDPGRPRGYAQRLLKIGLLSGRVVRPSGQVTETLGAVRHLLGRVAAGDVTAGTQRVTNREALTYLAGRPELGRLLRDLIGEPS
ncbi:hypothetical protein ACFL59_05515, partial [Planctomycetota bacterium]